MVTLNLTRGFSPKRSRSLSVNFNDTTLTFNLPKGRPCFDSPIPVRRKEREKDRENEIEKDRDRVRERVREKDREKERGGQSEREKERGRKKVTE